MRALLFVQGCDGTVAGYSLEGTPPEVEAFRRDGRRNNLQAWFDAGWKMTAATPHASLNCTTLVVLERKRGE